MRMSDAEIHIVHGTKSLFPLWQLIIPIRASRYDTMQAWHHDISRRFLCI